MSTVSAVTVYVRGPEGVISYDRGRVSINALQMAARDRIMFRYAQTAFSMPQTEPMVFVLPRNLLTSIAHVHSPFTFTSLVTVIASYSMVLSGTIN